MKSIRISDSAYSYLQSKAIADRRSITATLDVVIEESKNDFKRNKRTNK